MVLVANKADLESDRQVRDTLTILLLSSHGKHWGRSLTPCLSLVYPCTELRIEFSFGRLQVSFQEGEELAQELKVQWNSHSLYTYVR